MEWISVKERSPEPDSPNDDTVPIIIYFNGVVSFGILKTEDGVDWDYYEIDGMGGSLNYCGDGITHWMYLPEPPKQ